MTPTARTLAALRKAGIPAQVVERWVRFGSDPTGGLCGKSGVRKDLFGCIDVIALRDHRIVGIQCCAMSGRAAHLAKIAAEPLAETWRAAGGRLEVWAWRKVKLKRGGKAVRWQVEVTTL
jgi:hypothetical protein